MNVRPLVAADVDAVVRLLWAALPPLNASDADARMRRRLAAALAHDPTGAWVAEDAAGLAGIALAVRRDGIWVLSWLGVHPGARSQGVGSRLLAAALEHHGEGCRGFLIASSDDPRAMRLYARAGFAHHPSVRASGVPRLDGAPVLEAVREGDEADFGHCVEVDRAVRGGGRRLDLEFLAADGARLFVHAEGYAFSGRGAPLTLAARDEGAARLLLWRVLVDVGEGKAEVDWITARQRWALDVVLDAGLAPDRGYVYFTRGELGPLAPWLPNNALL